MSAKTASIEDNISGGMYMNRSTRTALNQVVKSLSIDLEKDHVNVLAMSPGWVKTDSGGKWGVGGSGIMDWWRDDRQFRY